MKYLKYIFFLILFSIECISYGTAGDKAIYETRYIIDMPTAGMLKQWEYSINFGYQYNNNLYLEFNTAFYDWLNLSTAFSGNNLLGNETPEFQKYPSLHLKTRILNETKNIPAVVLGFSNQKKGLWNDEFDDYEIFSTGFYLAISRNYKWNLGNLALHFGVNYSFDPEVEDRFINYYIGLEQSIGNYLAMNIEFNPHITANKNLSDIMNLSLRASVIKGLTFELRFNKLLSKKEDKGFNRSLYIDFINKF